MIEKVFNYSTGDEGVIEKIIMNNDLNYIHMVFKKGEKLPEHFSNSNIYMTVIRGELSLKLNDQKKSSYSKGDIINIPYDVKMNVQNETEEILELIVIKAPAPGRYKAK